MARAPSIETTPFFLQAPDLADGGGFGFSSFVHKHPEPIKTMALEEQFRLKTVNKYAGLGNEEDDDPAPTGKKKNKKKKAAGSAVSVGFTFSSPVVKVLFQSLSVCVSPRRKLHLQYLQRQLLQISQLPHQLLLQWYDRLLRPPPRRPRHKRPWRSKWHLSKLLSASRVPARPWQMRCTSVMRAMYKTP